MVLVYGHVDIHGYIIWIPMIACIHLDTFTLISGNISIEISILLLFIKKGSFRLFNSKIDSLLRSHITFINELRAFELNLLL